MDHKSYLEEAFRAYSFDEPAYEFIRHNENLTYKITDKRFRCLLRLHKPIARNMEGIQTTPEAIRSELAFCSHGLLIPIFLYRLRLPIIKENWSL